MSYKSYRGIKTWKKRLFMISNELLLKLNGKKLLEDALKSKSLMAKVFFGLQIKNYKESDGLCSFTFFTTRIENGSS
jgi:hypothetical protein